MMLASSSAGEVFTKNPTISSLTNANDCSLPSNVDHVEMMTMLSEHLSEHSEIQSIKVVRDSKGGACAFIQCQVRCSLKSWFTDLLLSEDTDSAAKLLDILRSSPPRHFMGRYLRYEPARAFRTLLISYR